MPKWVKWIDLGINNWISVDENGNEFLNGEDIVNLKTDLSKAWRDRLSFKTKEVGLNS